MDLPVFGPNGDALVVVESPRGASIKLKYEPRQWRSYERLRQRAFEAEMRADEAFTLRAECLLARIDKPKCNRPDRKRSFWR